MIGNANACDDDRLLEMLRGESADTEADGMLEHVESCSHCQQRLDDLVADESQWQKAIEVLSSRAREQANAGGAGLQRSLHLSRLNERPSAWTESMARQLLSPPSHPEMLGRIGRYDVERLIGSGGMGVVFKAYDTELHRPVAVKLLAPYLASSGASRARFAREARAAAAVVDDHVVPIHNVETEGEHPFLVMKYVVGGSLQQRLDRDGPLDVCEVLRVGMQTAKGLAAAHAQGLIHRDVKPSNVLLDEGVERALLTDFGLARATDDASLTRSGYHPGTPHYMSPEQVRGEAIDARSDLFGLGCMLYALCTGHPPFRSETSFAVLRRITDDTPRPIRETNADVPQWLERIVIKLLAKSPDERFDSAAEVAALLEDCLAHVQQPTTVSLPESIEQLSQQIPAAPAAANSPQKQLRQWFYTRPPIGKFIAAAAFAFALLFAGVLIVLELNKGTLTIESELEGVPIRITQGDKIVEQMVVTQGEKSTRIAAGSYVVEVDGTFAEISVVDGGKVLLQRGGTSVVRIVRKQINAPLGAHASRASQSEQAARRAAQESFERAELNAQRAHRELDQRFSRNNDDDARYDDPKAEPDAVVSVPGTAGDEALHPEFGDVVLLSLTGDVAREYAKIAGMNRNGELVDNQEIETSASIVQRLSDGRFRLEHHSSPRVVFKEYHIVLLMATVEPSAISKVTIPQGTIVGVPPGALIESPQAKDTHVYRLTLSHLDDVVMKNLTQPLPPKAAALSELQFKRTSPALVHLLELNGDATSHIEKLGHPTDSAGIQDLQEIHSAGNDYIAVVARRFPPGIEQPFGQGGVGIGFLFDKRGNLLVRFGGDVGPDGVNGDEVQLLMLGTDDQWFAVVRRFEKQGIFKHRSDVFLIDDGFPLAFRNYEQRSMAWPSRPDPEHPAESPYFFNPGGLQSRALGKGKDGNEHLLIFAWDSAKRLFRGPSEITHDGDVLFRVDLSKSTKFQATDIPSDDAATSSESDPSAKRESLNASTTTDDTLSSATSNAVVQGPVAVVMVMHPGELRHGNSIQRAAAAKTLGLLTADDYCGILRYGFNQGGDPNTWLWGNGTELPRVGEHRKQWLATIAESTTGDFPTFEFAFKLALDALEDVGAGQKLMIVFTDGDPGFADEQLIDKFRAAEIKVSVIHVDVHRITERSLLKRLVDATGGTYHYALESQASVVETLFEREVQSLRADKHAALKKIGHAFHKIHEKVGSFPGSRMRHVDRQNNEFEHPFSWRVAILPYIGHQQLFNEYRFDEPWASDKNIALLAQMPDIYRSPHASVEQPPSNTNMLGFETEDGGLGVNSGEAMSSFTDGLSNTILIVEISQSVPWTKPEDLTQSKVQPFPGQSLRFILADGSVHEMSPVDEHELQKLITRNGGELIGREPVQADIDVESQAGADGELNRSPKTNPVSIGLPPQAIVAKADEMVSATLSPPASRDAGFPSDAVLQEMHDLLAEETKLDVKLRYVQQFLEGGKLFSETDSSQHAKSAREQKRILDRQQEIADRLRRIHENELGDLRKVAENAVLECSEEPLYGQSSYGVIVYATTLVPIHKDELLLFHAGALYRSKGAIRPLQTIGQGFYLRPNTGIPSGARIALSCIQDAEEERENVENGYMPDSDRARSPSRAYRANVFNR